MLGTGLPPQAWGAEAGERCQRGPGSASEDSVEVESKCVSRFAGHEVDICLPHWSVLLSCQAQVQGHHGAAFALQTPALKFFILTRTL